MTEQRLVDTYVDTGKVCWCRCSSTQAVRCLFLGEVCACVCLCVCDCDSPVVEGTPVYSGDTASAGELAEETPTEWMERAGEYEPGDGEVGVVSVSAKSSSLSAEGVRRGETEKLIL